MPQEPPLNVPLPPALAEAVLAGMGHAAVVTDLDGVVLYWNDAAEGLYGYSASEALGRPLGELIIPSAGREAARAGRQRVAEGEPYSGDWQVRHKSGRVFPVHVTTSVLRDPDGGVLGMLGLATDLRGVREVQAALRATQAELEASERAYRARFEQVALPQAVFDLTGRCTAANDALCELLGVPREELLGRNTVHLHHASDPASGQARSTPLMTGLCDADSWERVFSRPDGTPVPVYVHAALVRDADGEPQSIAAFVQDLTQLRDAEQRLQATVDRHQALLAHESDWLVVTNPEGELLYVSPAVGTSLGYDADEVVGESGWDFVHPDDAPASAAAIARVAAEPGRSEAVRVRIRDAHGRWTWFEEVFTNRLSHPAIGGIVCLGRDITERVVAEEALRASEEWFRSIAATAQEGIWAVSPQGRTLFANAKLAELLGHPLEHVYATPVGELVGGDTSPLHAVAARVAGLDRPEEHDVAYRHPTAGERRLRVSLSALPHAGETGWLGMLSDVTEVRRIEDELRQRALYDELTGLPNRTLLRDRLDQALARTARNPALGPVAVLLLDLDHFKNVNDTWGHGTGDELLRLVATRLTDAVRPSDTVARFGGDEFVVVCEGLEEAEVRALADRLIGAVGERADLGGRTTYVGVSVGMALSPPDSPEDLVRFADAAMYDAKARGRNRAQVFDVQLADAAADRLVLGNDLREALAADALAMHYQPVVALEDGELLAVEALARWAHPVRGDIAPDRFVRVGELTGQAPDLDAWALRRAAADAVRLRRELSDSVRVSVNVSAANLESRRLEEQLLAALDGSGVAPEALVLEVTENTLMARPDVARAALERLQAHGVAVAIDDFGTGYSSLAYLNRLPVTLMKIDRSFVAHLTDDPDAFAIAAAIVDLGRTLNLRTVAEGVETPEQLALLRQLGCLAGQGFLWSPARPVDELVEMVHGLPGRRFPVTFGADTAAPASRRRREQVTAEHGLTHLLRMHRDGASLATIASALNADGFRTPQGVRWHRASVARVISDLAYPQLREPAGR